MKRLSILLLVLLMLTACLPTPEHEYVINKSDNTVEEKISATPKTEESTVELQPSTNTVESAAAMQPSTETSKSAEAAAEALAPQRFPDRWDEDAADVNAYVSIAVHADLIQKADGLYPVYQIKDAPMTEADAQSLAEKILGKPTEAYISELTKEYWKNQLQNYLDEVAAWEEWVAVGSPNDVDHDGEGFTPEDVEAQTAWYMAKIQSAPDTLETKPVSDYSGLHENSEAVYTLASGEKATITYRRGFQIFRNCASSGAIYTEAEYEIGKDEDDPNAKLWHDPTMKREDAETVLHAEMERLNLSEYSVSTAQKACLLERTPSGKLQYKSNGWAFTLLRNPAGYPMSELPWEPSQFLNYGTDDGFAVNEPVGQEHITAFIDENGMQAFELYDRKEVTGLPNANVELLPFEDVQRIAKNTLAVCVGYDSTGKQKTELEIYRALLTTYTLRVKNSDEYYEMPCWALFFDYADVSEEYRMRMRESEFESHEVLLINAIDGSVIHPDYGY